MTFWETSDGNIEMISVLLANETNEVDGVLESVLGCYPFSLTFGWITSESENVVAARVVCVLLGAVRAVGEAGVVGQWDLCSERNIVKNTNSPPMPCLPDL